MITWTAEQKRRAIEIVVERTMERAAELVAEGSLEAVDLVLLDFAGSMASDTNEDTDGRVGIESTMLGANIGEACASACCMTLEEVRRSAARLKAAGLITIKVIDVPGGRA